MTSPVALLDDDVAFVTELGEQIIEALSRPGTSLLTRLERLASAGVNVRVTKSVFNDRFALRVQWRTDHVTVVERIVRVHDTSAAILTGRYAESSWGLYHGGTVGEIAARFADVIEAVGQELAD